MGIRLLTIGVALAMGCYSPSIAPCLYTCYNGVDCPDGLACNADHWCARTTESSCGSDGGSDGGNGCTWTDVSNVDACANRFDLISADWNIGGATTINTDTLAVTGSDALPTGAVKMVLDQGGSNTNPALVIVVHDLSIIAPVTVIGSLPVILVASGKVTITVDVIVTAGSSSSTASTNGRNGEGTTGGGGAGGGGFGTNGGGGGAGGAGSTVSGAGGSPGPVAAMTTFELVPLRGGLAGGTGGQVSQGGLGGKGGGAIEITAQTTIELTGGSIRANGGGGQSAMSGVSGGGGGGGAGGAIFLEAAMVTLSSSMLCANGGGGGGSQPGSNGMESDCNLPGVGGAHGSSNNSGGDGAIGTLSGTAGTPGAPTLGGGGGGGGVGLIRIRGALVRNSTPISPPNGT